MHTYDFEHLGERGGREPRGDVPRLGGHIDTDEGGDQAFPAETVDGDDIPSSVERGGRTLPPPASDIRTEFRRENV